MAVLLAMTPATIQWNQIELRRLFACFRFDWLVYAMDSIPNFTPTDIEMVQQLVHHRYQERVEIQVTDSEFMLTSEREQLVDYPKLF